MQVHMYIHNTKLFSPSTFSTYVPQQNMKSVYYSKQEEESGNQMYIHNRKL